MKWTQSYRDIIRGLVIKGIIRETIDFDSVLDELKPILKDPPQPREIWYCPNCFSSESDKHQATWHHNMTKCPGTPIKMVEVINA